MGKFYNIAKNKHTYSYSKYHNIFCQLNFSFKINLAAIRVITIELEFITEVIETFPSNKENLLNIDDDTSNKDCNIKYFCYLSFVYLYNSIG